MITPPTPYLSTERLGLEPLRIFHSASMIKLLRQRPGYDEARGDSPTYELLTREYAMLVAGSRHETEQWHNWILRHRENRRVIGHVRFTLWAHRATARWTMGTAWQNQGYESEATTAAVSWLVTHGAHSLKDWTHPERSSTTTIIAAAEPQT